jgi:hypothetical protein
MFFSAGGGKIQLALKYIFRTNFLLTARSLNIGWGIVVKVFGFIWIDVGGFSRIIFEIISNFEIFLYRV